MRDYHGIEQTVMAGGYGYRQILELVQNSADAILEVHESGLGAGGRNRVHVMLRGSKLYGTNIDSPLSHDGISALLSAYLSPKRSNQIGRFGLRFVKFDTGEPESGPAEGTVVFVPKLSTGTCDRNCYGRPIGLLPSFWRPNSWQRRRAADKGRLAGQA